jgi:uncharacterized protein YjbI with pentapeptide repeats
MINNIDDLRTALRADRKIEASGADLHNADLSHASLIGADLTGVNLSGASLTRSNLHCTATRTQLQQGFQENRTTVKQKNKAEKDPRSTSGSTAKYFATSASATARHSYALAH